MAVQILLAAPVRSGRQEWVNFAVGAPGGASSPLTAAYLPRASMPFTCRLWKSWAKLTCPSCASLADVV